MATRKKPDTKEIVIPKIEVRELTVRVAGVSSLICHRWSEKARKEILDKQMKKAKSSKAAKDPVKDFEESLYPHPEGGYGFPAIAFKSAVVDAASFADNVTKVVLRGALHVVGELVRIEGDPTMREDLVRIGMGTADIRFRGEFKAWQADIPVQYNPAVLSEEQIVHLFNLAGFSLGVGEWRPQRNGEFGRFRVLSWR